MGDRRSVREATAAYFGGPLAGSADGGIWYQGGPLASAGLGTAFPYLVKGSAPDVFYTAGNSALGWGAVLTVRLGPARITRRPDGGYGGPTSGWRARHYTTVLGLDVISYDEHLETAEAGLDDLTDALLDLIYADRTLGTTGGAYASLPGGRLIVQAGEGTQGITTGLPEWAADPDRGRGRGGLDITFDILTMVAS